VLVSATQDVFDKSAFIFEYQALHCLAELPKKAKHYEENAQKALEKRTGKIVHDAPAK
jgi:hypothetical protein